MQGKANEPPTDFNLDPPLHPPLPLCPDLQEPCLRLVCNFQRPQPPPSHPIPRPLLCILTSLALRWKLSSCEEALKPETETRRSKRRNLLLKNQTPCLAACSLSDSPPCPSLPSPFYLLPPTHSNMPKNLPSWTSWRRTRRRWRHISRSCNSISRRCNSSCPTAL